MPHEVIMPALGMAQDTGKIVRWLKSAGDPVKVGDALFEVETDKATMEVESPADGYLTQVKVEAGTDVPVGEVIAHVADAAGTHDTATMPPEQGDTNDEASLPEGKNVIMPALGMAQDSGVIVAWHKALGDAVAAGDILFEVETDKATMDVEAGADGFVAALLAEASEAAPVGDTIAIISADPPAKPVQRRIADGAAPKRTATPETPSRPEAKDAPKPASAPTQSVGTEVPEPVGHRILASPKARRLALEQGLDLNRLVQVGHAQPFHVADLERLRKMPEPMAEPSAIAARRITADLPVDGFAEFAEWAAQNADLTDQNALLAGFAAASLGADPATIVVERFGQSRAYDVPTGAFSAIRTAAEDSVPDLILRDLRMTRLSTVALGVECAPSLTLTEAGDGLSITLECAGHHLSARGAVSLLSEFAGRMEHPLRHLL